MSKLYESINKGFNRRYLKEDYQDTVIKCENFLEEYLYSQFLDNIALVLETKVPEYNTDWANDEDSYEFDIAVEQFITALINDLFYYHEDNVQ